MKAPTAPKTRAVWLWGTTHPGCTAGDVVAALNIRPNQAHKHLRALVKHQVAKRHLVDGIYHHSMSQFR